MEEKERLEKIIKQVAASIWLDNLPLSREYIEKYKKERLIIINHSKTLVKRGEINGKSRSK